MTVTQYCEASKMAYASGVLFAACLVAFCVPALQEESSNKVVVGYYAESLCPDCIDLSIGAMNKAVNEVCIN